MCGQIPIAEDRFVGGEIRLQVRPRLTPPNGELGCHGNCLIFDDVGWMLSREIDTLRGAWDFSPPVRIFTHAANAKNTEQGRKISVATWGRRHLTPNIHICCFQSVVYTTIEIKIRIEGGKWRSPVTLHVQHITSHMSLIHVISRRDVHFHSGKQYSANT